VPSLLIIPAKHRHTISNQNWIVRDTVVLFSVLVCMTARSKGKTAGGQSV